MMISPTSSTPYVSPLTAPTSAAAADPSTSSSSTPASGTQLSGFAAFMSKLQGLEQSDPTAAKSQLTSIASKLSSEAKQVGGTRGQHLSALADKFQTAAQTGNLSGLQSTAVQSGQTGSAGHHHGGGHGHKQLSAYQQSSDSSQDLLDSLNNAVSTSAAA